MYNEHGFREKVQRTLGTLKKILDESRHPLMASEVHHQYADKFALADFLTNSSLAAQVNCLESLGLDEAKLRTLQEAAAKGTTVTLRLTAEETCSFLRSEKREIDAGSKHVTTGVMGKKESKVVTVLTEYTWRRGVSYEISALLRPREWASRKLSVTHA